MKKMNIELEVNEEPSPDPRDWSNATRNSQGPEEVPPEESVENRRSDPMFQDSVVDLDMDAIIQSFFNEQQAVHSSDFPSQDFQRVRQPSMLPNLHQQVPGDGYGQPWGMFDLAGDESFDDTLFGELPVPDYIPCDCLADIN